MCFYLAWNVQKLNRFSTRNHLLLLEVGRTNTHVVTWPFLAGCHQEINKGFMRYTSVYACHWKTYYNFCLLASSNSNQSDITLHRSAISVRESMLLATSLCKPLLMKNKCKMASVLKRIFLSGISPQWKGVLLQTFINFHYSLRPIFWWYCIEDWVCGFCVWIN